MLLRSLITLGLILSFAPAPALAQNPAEAGGEGGVAARTSDEGPRLELDGLEEAAPATAAAPLHAPAESFSVRLDPGITLSDRAAAIIDRTTIGGYGEHDFVVPQQGTTTFVAHRYVVFIYSRISERISTATEVEFEFAGSPLKRDGVLSFGEVLLEFSVVDVMLTDWMTFRAGVILVPFGAYNLRHDAPAQELPERPIAYTTVVPTTWFESGAGFLGQFGLGEHSRLTYEIYAINGLDAKILDGQGFRAARGSNLEDNNNDKAIVGRVAYSPWLGLELGFSGYTGAYDRINNRVNMVNGDMFWRLGSLDLHGEAVWAFIDPGFVQGFRDGSPANTRDRVPTRMRGYYGQADYHFRIEPFFELLPEEWHDGYFTASVRYEEKDTDMEFVTAAGDAAKLTVGLNIRPVPAYALKQAFSLEQNGASGVQPHLWSSRFFPDSNWQYIASVAYLF
ncbi:hypothetical protein [Vulgatibacter incomptus]|uniref:Phosphate-selective porin O and P n=1 Tax=Vulgatibacter incomptus TaxID=1391653 RepID=A0A0K1PC53_9BACT|nr:hypothetical protein [Vulgatibacter incomptus]AKU91087.1 hypothetical protein AKJ08_1474 [Vulgatibacter incomptus]